MKRPHPSGRPILRPETRGLSIFRIPFEGSIIPRLQVKYGDISAVGFHHRFVEQERDDYEGRK